MITDRILKKFKAMNYTHCFFCYPWQVASRIKELLSVRLPGFCF